MQERSIYLQLSKSQGYLYLGFGLFFIPSCIWLGYRLIFSNGSPLSFLLALFLCLLCLLFATKQFTGHLQYANGYLTFKSLFVNQHVHLPSLTRAERYMSAGNFPQPLLQLQDDAGNKLIIRPGDYDMKDFEELVAFIHPYIFVTRVDKNFMDLKFSIEQGLNIPRTRIKQALLGTLLYVILPCLVLTALVLLWGIATKQPAFSQI